MKVRYVNNKIQQKILSICNKEYKYFLNLFNVLGIGLGFKVIKGFYTNLNVITVFVKRKMPLDKLCSKDLIPPIYKGIRTDVIETGIIKSSSLTKRVRPTLGGYSIGANGVKDVGSISCLVTDDEYYYILGNNHILAYENMISIGTPILQPGMSDGGVYPRDMVAKLSKFIPLKFDANNMFLENYVDCAIAKLIEPSIASSRIKFVGKPRGITEGKIDEKVVKVGRTTEESYGKISNIGATINVNFDKGKALFKNQLVTTKMTAKGDSGSLVMNNNMYGIGLYFADSLTLSYVNPISTVLNELNVKIVTR